jgi:hypothetical protein
VQLEPKVPSPLGTLVQEGALTRPRKPWFGPLKIVKLTVALSISLDLSVMITCVSSLVAAVIL